MDLIESELAEVLSEHNIDNLSERNLMGIIEKAKIIQKEKARKREVAELEKIKFDIDYKDIKVSLGVPWIDENFICDFASHIINRKIPYDHVVFEKYSGLLYIFKGIYGSERFGTMNYSALHLLESTLNLRDIKVMNDYGELDEIATLEALEKQKLMIREFENWVWKDDYRRLKITQAYNEIFSKFSKNETLDILPTFEGLNENIKLYDYQKMAVRKILSRKNSLIATEVGTGKTYMMIVSAMEMRHNDISKKNMFVVPNNIIFQWKAMFNMLYKDARVLLITPQEFKKQNKNKILNEIKNSVYDAIIIAYSCFDRLNINKELVLKKLRQDYKKLENIKKDYQNYNKQRLVDKKIDSVGRRICQLTLNKNDEEEIYFDELGITGLFVDEAHNYKNLRNDGLSVNAKGVNSVSSKKCDEMLSKVRYIQSNGGRVVFATGTPLSNSLVDSYTMQVYLQYDELCEVNLNSLRSWSATFGRIEEVVEVDSTGNNFCISKRFYQFVNLPELSQMFSKISIFHTNEKSDLPQNVEYFTTVIDGGDNFKRYMAEIVNRVEKIKMALFMGNRKYFRVDNMLKICTDGRKAALDLKLVNREQEFVGKSKIWNCLQNVMEIYKEYPNTSQIIFCDYSIPKANEYNVYEEVKERLFREGVNSSEIAFIHDYTSEDEKGRLFEKVNSAEIRILIGSTVKLGVGVNVQTRLKAIHHLDVPWRPSDITQREGRIIRQGNINENVKIYRYVVKNSFDAYFWQLLEYKQTFISQFLSGAANQRTISDLETNVLGYGTVKALALDNPEIKTYTEKVNELKLAKIVLMKNVERHNDIIGEIENLKLVINSYNEDLETINNINEDLKKKSIEIIKAELNKQCLILEENCYEVGLELEILGFKTKIFTFKDGQEKKMQLSKDGVSFYIELGDKDTGNRIRLVHFFERFEKEIENILVKIKQCKDKISNLENELVSIDLSENNVNKLEVEVKKLQEKIREGSL